ncbi:dixin isoform X2 [Varanus komodoensis]|uniref:dixin isoform X2 n=1 Tax=Varanus komodoensis TaxID=61221 RepID=UPI001CF79FE7|nr:dixin isoform X2 [Varanus komodoensis]
MGGKQVKCSGAYLRSAGKSGNLTSPSPINSAKSDCSAAPSEEKAGSDICHEEDADARTEEWQARCPTISLETSWEEQLLEQQDHLEKEMEEAKKMISGLQALLLNGSLPEDEQGRALVLCEQETCPEEQLIILRGRLDQSMEENQELKKELQKQKQEARNLQGVKDALQQRLTQQDTLMLQIKQELLRASMDKEDLHSQNADLQRKVEERNRLLAEYKKELGQKDRHLHQHQAKMEEMLRQLSEASYQQAELERELERKEAILAQCVKKDAEEVIVCSSLGSQTNGFLQTSGKGPLPAAHRGSGDLQLVREALRSLRNSFSGHDPQHHTIDSLEQGISSLMERLHRMEAQKRQERRVRGKSPAGHTTNEYRDSWPPNSKLPHSHSTPAMSSSACTKVLYFTDRSLTPFMVNIPKRLGEVTLKDFKAAIDREGTHRYHFKALDPEFGTVKEEVFHDDDIIPGWEGKIVAWVEEDHGEN